MVIDEESYGGLQIPRFHMSNLFYGGFQIRRDGPRTRVVVASAHDGIVCISGLDNGEVVKFYAADGKLVGSSSAVDGTASCAVSETMVIAKFGDNAIKVAVK